MPLRLYECACGHVFEELITGLKISAPCPMCNKQALYQFGTASAHFKGTGFYETDYKEKS